MSAVTITTYMSLLTTPLALVTALVAGVWPTPAQFGWLTFISAVGNLGQLCLSQAPKEADTNVAMSIDFFLPIWIARVAYLAFAEFPDVPT